MASKFFHHPVPPSQADPFTFTPKITRMIAAQNLAPALQLRTKSLRLFKPSSGFRHTIHYTINAAGESTGQKEKEASKDRTVDLIKADFYRAVQGINRGIFGVQSARKSEIEELVELLESRNPTPDPALHLDKVGGCWRLVYSTITILGVKRTKLGLRHFLTLGNIYQTIDVAKAKAINVIKFEVRGLSLLHGQLTIEASFKISSKSRVDICYDKSTITPDQLGNVLSKKYDLLLSIFNPEGWLQISYVDNTMMIGRDDKGNTFVLERSD